MFSGEKIDRPGNGAVARSSSPYKRRRVITDKTLVIKLKKAHLRYSSTGNESNPNRKDEDTVLT